MRPIIDEEMIEAGVSALRDERLVMGESVHKFEEEFARYCGTRYAVSTGSGTAALQIAIQSIGVKSDDEVLTTPFSFFATSNAIIHAGAQPRFADVENSGFNLDPGKISEKITSRTRVVLPVHLYGQPARMDEFSALAKEHGMSIVEDACQAHGAEYDGRKIGSLGLAGCFSFYSSKNMTVGGDGGMITTDDEELANAARSFRDCGRASRYEMSRVGFTSRLDTWNSARRGIANLYRRELEGVDGITLPPTENPKETPVYHLFVIRSQNRDPIMKHLEENGIESAIHYPIPIHLQAHYRRQYGFSEGSFPQSEKLAREVLSLPMHPMLTEQQVHQVSETVREAVQLTS